LILEEREHALARGATIYAEVVGYGTATDRGDIAESMATHRVFGNNVAISTLKGNLGHTLGAFGGINTSLVFKRVM
jgi:3-oxoacyl-[acyl-carrier-protein] synthase II